MTSFGRAESLRAEDALSCQFGLTLVHIPTEKFGSGWEVARMRDVYQQLSSPLVWLTYRCYIGGADVSKASRFLDVIAQSIHVASSGRYRASHNLQKDSHLREETDVTDVVSAYNKLIRKEPYPDEIALRFHALTHTA